ncbi:putative telomerase activating protein Est1 [Dioscorea sansibarensis]
MAVPMDENLSAPTERDRAQRLFQKNAELENGLRMAAQSKIPSDPNTWRQMRDNYEAIILEDHEFSEKHEVEYLLWQLHYRRIEEFRSHINSANSAASGGAQPQGGKVLNRSERIMKIRSVFKSFLSEATGFYNDLTLKIKSKYGLHLGFFFEGADNHAMLTKDEKRSSEIKKGLLSCHRCMIYLGDLARYKGLYGDVDSASRDYAASSSYYVQAASLWPASGNPHHQLAILASYSGNDLVAVYRYFRSLAVDSPFSTARDNLIIAFEKNRLSYSLLSGSAKVPSAKTMPTRPAGRGRGRGDARLLSKVTKAENVPVKEQELSTEQIFRSFSTRFVRLNGIVFTRTSLETFGEVFSLLTSDLNGLLGSGPEEQLNFGVDAAENGLTVVRLIAILIFTVHNANRESEGQSYAEILQRTVLLQNAFTSAFEFTGHILKRCVQLRDAASSYLLPAIMVFIEWLACHPDIAAGLDVEEKQASARSFFWNQYVLLLNKLVLSGFAFVESDEDETCFSDMSQYDDEETGNRLALWEDFELRGFSPLVPAQLVLDFSRKQSYGGDGSNKEKKVRAQRIVSAGKTLMNVIRVDQKRIYFDPNMKKFVISTEPRAREDQMRAIITTSPAINVSGQGNPVENTFYLAERQPKTQFHAKGEEEEEEEEEIVFKPTLVCPTSASKSNADETTQTVESYSGGDWSAYGGIVSAPLSSVQMSTALNASYLTAPKISQHTQHISTNPLKWSVEQEALNSEGLRNLKMVENGWFQNQRLPEGLVGLHANMLPPSFSVPANHATNSMIPSQMMLPEAVIPSKLDSIVHSGGNSDGMPVKLSAGLPTISRKTPVSRPARHFGPPPGFSHVPSKQPDESFANLVRKEQQAHPVDDYSWLDGRQSSMTKGVVGMENSMNHASLMHPNVTTGVINNSSVTMDFPFPGKQVSSVQTPAVSESWQDFQLFDQRKQFPRPNLPPASLPRQHQPQSLWSGPYFV